MNDFLIVCILFIKVKSRLSKRRVISYNCYKMDFNKQYCTTIYNNENEDNRVYESEMGICEKGSDELLIDAIKNYPHLYNPALKEFKDSQMKENSWIEISNVMDMSSKIYILFLKLYINKILLMCLYFNVCIYCSCNLSKSMDTLT